MGGETGPILGGRATTGNDGRVFRLRVPAGAGNVLATHGPTQPRRYRMRSAALAVCFAVVLVPSTLEGRQVSGDLQGAWRVTEIVTTGPGGSTNGSPQPGILIFTDRHYSYTLVTGDRPRPELGPGIASAEDLLGVWGPFTANAGTYEVSGDSMTRRPIVAKSPDAMAQGAYNEYTFRLIADTLWIAAVGTEAGRARYPSTVRYVRLR